ncbi:hypothetical protein J2S19_003354 [Metabacillus malikii]|uniref:Uncharacterized protein n=1 Tax=Metabacillus malikii TaxID=1504265 RepID=A0ABT9ZJJ3_9BACI|nr:hypothetical protein [Metabacillus malikii]
MFFIILMNPILKLNEKKNVLHNFDEADFEIV